MSASVYNNPYFYKPPPKRIDYPSFFSCFDQLTFRYLLDSKILAIAVLVCGVANLVVFGMIICPFWFTLSLSPSEGTFGSEPLREETKIDAGIFYMRATQFDNTVFLDKYTNADAVPHVIQAAQFFSIFSMCTMIGCLGASCILLVRKYGSITALIILAAANTLAAVMQILIIFLCVALVVTSDCAPGDSGCAYSDNLAWRNVPVYTQFYRIEPKITPMVELNWAFYIACIGALICIGSAVLFWLESFMTSNTVRKIRYQQLRQKRDPHEDDWDPSDGRKYVYKAPTTYSPNMYGMQPVMSSHPYEGVVLAPSPGYVPPIGFSQQPQGYNYPPPPEYGGRQGPPSSVSFSSAGEGKGPVVSREIDL